MCIAMATIRGSCLFIMHLQSQRPGGRISVMSIEMAYDGQGLFHLSPAKMTWAWLMHSIHVHMADRTGRKSCRLLGPSVED
jgi:hypothetical protein